MQDTIFISKKMNDNDYKIDFITTVNSFYYLKFLFFRPAKISATNRISYTIAKFYEKNREISSNMISEYLKIHSSSFSNIFSKLKKEGIISKTDKIGNSGSKLYIVSDIKKCRKKYTENLSDKIEMNGNLSVFEKYEVDRIYKALWKVYIGENGDNMETPVFTDIFIYADIFFNRIISEGNNGITLIMQQLIMTYLLFLEKDNVAILQDIIPYQSQSNLKEYLIRMSENGLIEYQKNRCRQYIVTEKGIESLISFYDNINKSINNNISKIENSEILMEGIKEITKIGIFCIKNRERFPNRDTLQK